MPAEVIGMRAQVEDVSVLLAGRVRTPAQRLVNIGWIGTEPGSGSGVPVALVREFPVEADQGRPTRLPYTRVTAPGHPNRQGKGWLLVRSWCRSGDAATHRCWLCGVNLSSDCRLYPVRRRAALRPVGMRSRVVADAARLAADWCVPNTAAPATFRPEARAPPKNCAKRSGSRVVTSDAEVGVIRAVDAPAEQVGGGDPGAEPVATGGYPAALLLDADQALAGPGSRARREALVVVECPPRRWCAHARLVGRSPWWRARRLQCVLW